MADKSHLIWQIFQTIQENDNGQILWNLLEQITTDNGIVYMKYGNETPQSLAEKLHRQNLLKLIQLHQKLTYHRAQF
ncbi:unnamed protein product [Adineta steineri]|uniref:Uncharacterized protein n=1 Tax=Adineta steineri TaxID=433720 RepID=A0A814I667_9BILA|nr:unnamed protein product [Adineta steineri]CAF0977864.1 unnamed protein product [Adineta steineri]CAF1019263.1 unnamed protein product [Adineta steineri]CAF1040277.1 unnamed protein product [Adineta steineri]CAF1117951.1 unnamed protein product [Adineta steineri]